MSEQFPPQEFDDWAASYDESVSASAGFPFAGYDRLLGFIYDAAAPAAGYAVLDLGVGTGNLAAPFAALGCQVWGLDFSAEMLARARVKLPGVFLGQADLRSQWPAEFQRRYDCIISAYTFHHFLLDEKVRLVGRLLADYLSPGGRLVIGDVAFADGAAQEEARRSLGSEWEKEPYWLADEALAACAAAGIGARFTKLSFCAGVFQFWDQGQNL